MVYTRSVTQKTIYIESRFDAHAVCVYMVASVLPFDEPSIS